MLARKWSFRSHFLTFLCQNVEEINVLLLVAEGLNEYSRGPYMYMWENYFFKSLILDSFICLFHFNGLF
jgi:hypothetical protein